MASRDEIIAFLDELLNPSSFDDLGPNGLQVPGSAEVDKVVTGVSAQLELFEHSVRAGAQLVLCHHGIFWDFHPRALTPALAARLRCLLSADISLAAYHLPLDAHEEVGNNSLLCAALGLERGERFGSYKGREIGYVGRSREGITSAELRERCAATLGQESFAWEAGPDVVHSVGIVSGGAASSLAEAAARGLDAFLTGEPAEHSMADAREAGVHFIAAGHYATETLGVRRLGDLVAERFGVRHEFVDIPNPI